MFKYHALNDVLYSIGKWSYSNTLFNIGQQVVAMVSLLALVTYSWGLGHTYTYCSEACWIPESVRRQSRRENLILYRNWGYYSPGLQPAFWSVYQLHEIQRKHISSIVHRFIGHCLVFSVVVPSAMATQW